MATGEDPDLSPTVFLIEQDANTVLPAHFHRQNQYQVFIEGSGLIGSHRIEPITVHYAGAYTGYGPLVAGSKGLRYFTIRPVFETGAVLLKDAKTQMRKGPKRGAHLEVSPPTTARLIALTRTEMQVALPPSDDGLGVYFVFYPPGERLKCIPCPGSLGFFLLIVEGSVVDGATKMQKWESLFANTGEELPDLLADHGGAAVLWLFVPPKDTRYC